MSCEVVCHVGRSVNTGKWSCRKCRDLDCEHISRARKHEPLAYLLEDVESAADEEAEDEGQLETEQERGMRVFVLSIQYI